MFLCGANPRLEYHALELREHVVQCKYRHCVLVWPVILQFVVIPVVNLSLHQNDYSRQHQMLDNKPAAMLLVYDPLQLIIEVKLHHMEQAEGQCRGQQFDG